MRLNLWLDLPSGRSCSRGAAIWAAALLVILASCSSSDDEGSGVVPAFANDLGAIRTPAQLADGLTSMYVPDPEFERIVQDEISACMARQGFEYVPYVEPSESEPFSNSPAIDGFERAMLGPPSASSDPNEMILLELDRTDPQAGQKYRETLWGTADNLDVDAPENGFASLDLSLEAQGCWNFTAIQMRGGLERLEYTDSLQKIDDHLWKLITGDERYKEAEGAFERCLAEIGIDSMRAQFEQEYLKLEELVEETEDVEHLQPEFDRVRQLEIAVVTAERDCEEGELSRARDDLAELYFDEAVQAAGF